MKHVIVHDLGVPMAKKVTERAFAEYEQRYAKYDPKFHWASDRKAEITIHAMGVTLAGAMEVSEGEITVDVRVPFILRPFRGRAMEIIEREVKVWLGRAHAGELG